MIQFLKKNKKVVIPAAILLVLAGLYFIFRGGGNAQAQYQTVEVQKGELVATVGATGTVRARMGMGMVPEISGSRCSNSRFPKRSYR